MKGTKTNENRSVPVPAFLVKELKEFSKGFTGPFVFSAMDGEQPIDHKWIVDWLYRAFSEIGITERKRKARNITFHSWRHFFNSRLRGSGIADSLTQKVTGHKTVAMSDHYTHFSTDDFAAVQKVQEGIFAVERRAGNRSLESSKGVGRRKKKTSEPEPS